MLNPDIPEPDFFIGGYPRSGTTMLSELLNQNGNILIPPETQFYRLFLRDTRTEKIGSQEELIEFFCQYPRIKDLDLKPEEFIKYKDHIAQDSRNLLGISLSLLSKKNNRKYTGEKSPANILYYDNILSFYRKTKFLFLVRDGRDCVFSNLKQEWTHNNYLQHATEWNLYYECYCKAVEKYPGRLLLIKYEDLVENSSQKIDAIFEFIGYESQNIKTKENKEYTSVPEWELGWKNESKGNVFKDRAYSWRKSNGHKYIKEIDFLQRTNLKKSGYEIMPQNLFVRIYLYLKLFIYNNLIYRHLLRKRQYIPITL